MTKAALERAIKALREAPQVQPVIVVHPDSILGRFLSLTPESG